jgi:8-oxo-dGTP diphosphatase
MMLQDPSFKVPLVGVGCIPVHGGRVLLVRNQRGFWSTPGGHLDFGEAPSEAAFRETLEETGVTVRQIEFVAITNDVMPESGKHYVTIWVRGIVDDPTVRIRDTAEIAEAAWFDPKDLPHPRHVYFDNLICGRSLPASPHNLPPFAGSSE